MASLMPYVTEINFASVVDKVTIGCKIAFQLIVEVQRMKSNQIKTFFCLDYLHNQNPHSQQQCYV